MTVEEFKFTFVNCDASDYDAYGQAGISWHNTFSVGVYVDCGTTKLFVPADMTAASFTHLESINQIEYCHVMTAPHHGIEINGNAYLRIRPEVVVAQVGPAHEYSHDNMDANNMYLNSSDVTQANAIGIPFYITGYGNVYVGISDNDYCVIPAGKNVYSIIASGITLYVDDTYNGFTFGTADKPFNRLEQAIAFAEYLQGTATVTINIVGEYNHPDEVLHINCNRTLTINGTKTDNEYNVKLLCAYCTNCVDLQIKNVEFTRADNTAPVRVTSGKVTIDGCKITTSTLSVSALYYGMAVHGRNNATVLIHNCEISNRYSVVYLEALSNAYLVDNTGSNNSRLFGVDEAGIINANGTVPTFTEHFVEERSNRGAVAVISPSQGFSENLASVFYRNDVSTVTTTVLNLGSSAYNRRMFIIFGDNGGVYRLYKKANKTYVGVDTIIQPTNPTADTDFNISLNANANTVTFTYNSHIIVQCL